MNASRMKLKIWIVVEHRLHMLFVQLPVHLSTRALHHDFENYNEG